MSGRIVRLSEELVNRIAAGEVVERPASVVKELIENSIDAGASDIIVDVKGSGKRYIRVTDDGIGMEREDAILCFERHATSKIKTSEDLYKITTLGFRGEAIPSIAAVSKVRLFTCLNGNSTGTELEVESGTIKSVKDAPPVKGTSVEVSDLFLNIPARLKFLKSDTTELSHIVEAVTQHALSHPLIRFKMNNANKKITDAASSNNILDRIVAVSGYEMEDNLMPVEENYSSRLKLRITGYISKPSVNMGNRGLQYIYVNSRYIRDRIINHAVYEAFKTMLPRDRHPIYFLFINIDPAMVDVNVHPSKTEVRFARQNEIHDFIRDIVMDSMKRGQGPEYRIQNSEYRIQETGVDYYKDRVMKAAENYIFNQEPKFSISSVQDLKLLTPNSEFELTPETESDLSHAMPIGQVFDSFIMLQGVNNIIFIDQHTAHERILYERILNKVRSSRIEVQTLLIPVNIELSGKESLIMQSNLDNFKKLGFDIESFGENNFIIRSLPSVLSGDDSKQIVRDILDKLLSIGKNTSFDEVINNMILVMACRSAVKAGQRLNMKEMESLIKELMNTARPFTCPHGRPIALSIEKGQILKGFLRR